MESKTWFTLIELIVVITILSILWTIAFVSLQWFSRDARDSKRISDLRSIEKSLAFHRTKGNLYPLPENQVDITYSWSLARSQWYFWKSLLPILWGITTAPTDPVTGKEYSYSVTANRNEFQLAGALQWNLISSTAIGFQQVQAAEDQLQAYVIWDYNREILKIQDGPNFIYILAVPSIINGDITYLDLIEILQNKEFVLHRQENLPDAYNGTNFDSNSVVDFDPDSLLVWSWNAEDLNTELSQQILFISNLQKTYSGSILVEINEDVRKIIEVNINDANPSNEVMKLASNILENDLKLSPTAFYTNTEEIVVDPPYTLPLTAINEIFSQESDFTQWWATNTCDSQNMNIVELTPGTNVIPTNLTANTVYLLEDGDYINWGITFATCSGIIWKWDNVSIFSPNQISQTFFLQHNRRNVIIANIKINGISDGSWWTHTRNTNGLMMTGWDSTVVNTNINNYNYALNTEKNNYRFVGLDINNNNIGMRFVSLSWSHLEQIQTYSNDNHGLYMFWSASSAQGNTFIDIDSYDNGSNGFIMNTSQGTITNIHAYNNGKEGMDINISDMILSQVNSSNNSRDGLRLNGSNNNFTDTITQGNTWYGIKMNSWISYNSFTHTKVIGNSGTIAFNMVGNYHTIQNLEMYDNSSNTNLRLDWNYHFVNNALIINNTHSIIISWQFSSLNNIVASNNNGELGQYPQNVFLNNAMIMNGQGVAAWPAPTYKMISHNLSTANTVSRWATWNIEYYGYINDISNPYPFLSSIVAGTNSSLWFTDGSLDSSITYDSSYAVTPDVLGWDTNLKGIQCEAWCTNANLTSSFDENTSFDFGSNIASQIQPVKYNVANASFELYGSQGVEYNNSKNIGQW